MTADDCRVAAIIALTALLLWAICRDAAREKRARRFDTHVEQAIEQTTVRPEHDDELRRILSASETPIHDAVAMSRLRRDLDQWGQR